MRRAHRNALALIGFLPIPKGLCCSVTSSLVSSQLTAIGARKDTDTEEFRMFKRDLTHRSIATILIHLKPFMTSPDVVLCADKHFRRAIYGLGPHISDYPEQAVLTWILLNWCPTSVSHLVSVKHVLTPKSSQVASPIQMPLIPHATIGLQSTPIFYLQPMMKRLCESCMASRLVLWYIF